MASIQKLGWFADNAQKAITIRMSSGVDKLTQSLKTPARQATGEPEQQPMVIVYRMDIQKNAGRPPNELLVTPLKMTIIHQPEQPHPAASTIKNPHKQSIKGSLHNSTLKQLPEIKVQSKNSKSVHHAKPQKLVNAQSRRKNLLDQINKLDNELNTINIEVGEGLQNDPSIRALELVRRMNEERRKRSEKVKLDFERVRKLQEERDIQKRLALEQIETERYMKKLELEEYERKQRLKASYRRMKVREEDVRGMVEGLVWQLVDSATRGNDDTVGTTLRSSGYHPINQNQPESTSLADSGVYRRDLRVSLVKTSGSKSKKLLGRELPEIILKVDTSKHIYPKTAFRQKILEEERKRREMERELEEQKRKVVSMRRRHNLPAVRLNRQPILNQKQNKQGDRSPDGMSKSMVSRTVQTEQNEEQSAFTQRVENGQQTQLKDQQSQSRRASPNRKRRNFRIAPVVQLQITKNKQNQEDNRSSKSKSESELSVEYEMQFFKSSNPVEQSSFDANQQIPDLGGISPKQQQFQRKLRHEIDFWRDFTGGQPADQERIFRKWVLETTQPATQQEKEFKQPVYDIFS